MENKDINVMEVQVPEGILSVLKVEHKVLSSGHREQKVLEQQEFIQYRKHNIINKNFCRKEESIQMKFSCFVCRKVLESVDALGCHMQGKKHQQNVETPPSDAQDYVLVNGKWKKREIVGGNASKRKLSEHLSKRERTKRNKLDRNMQILPQHTQQKYTETETYFEDGYRRVRPYYFPFVAHAKGRWVGKDLWSVFSKEFRAMPVQLFERCIEQGLIVVNDKKVSKDYRIENNDFIRHTVHRHELPVSDAKIQIVHEDDDVLVVNKPSSMPVHPCGRYRHNTVMFILAKEMGYTTLHTVHRLDRLTSGILIFAKSAGKSRELEVLIRGRQVQKEYICRVTGEFPEEEITVDEPIHVISYKIGVCIISDDGKTAKTQFKRLAYKDGVSVVICRPQTGRMHQIRVHLQYLGFPISNDPLYNSDVFGPFKGKNGDIGGSREQLLENLIAKHSVENWIQSEEYLNSKIKDLEEENEDEILTEENLENDFKSEINNELRKDEQHINNLANTTTFQEKDSTNGDELPIVKSPGKEDTEDYFDEHCQDCKTKYKDPPADTLLMFLHAYKYSGQGWRYETNLPAWANL